MRDQTSAGDITVMVILVAFSYVNIIWSSKVSFLLRIYTLTVLRMYMLVVYTRYCYL